MTSRWAAAPASPAAAALRTAGFPSPLADLLAQRGLADPAEAARFLAPSLEQLSPELPAMAAIAERLAAAGARGERVAVVGDYDVDGVSATALMAASLAALGAEVTTVLPRRDGEGYGLQALHVERAVREGATLVVAVDSGTSAFAAWEAAERAGVDLVVVDHHLPGGPIPAAVADGRWLLNPRLAPAPGGAAELTAAGLAARLAAALFARAGRQVPWPGLLRLAALGTIADVAPLTGDNRILAALGVAALVETPSPGLRELLRRAAVRPPLAAADVAFRLAPRLNAAGRLADADAALELLMTRDAVRAQELAERLEGWNAERQALERRMLDEAREQLARRAGLPWLIVLSSARWHRGVVGVAAARLARELHRPTVLLAEAGAEATGSGRSVAGLPLHELLSPWAGELSRFGGHAQAVGLTVEVARLDRLRAAWEAAAESWRDRLEWREHRYDLSLTLAEVGPALVEQLASLAPFGAGNPEPVFRFGPCRLAAAAERFGRGHLRFTVADAGDGRQRAAVVLWGGAETGVPALPPEFELLAAVESDRYVGVRLRAVDLRGVSPTTD